MPSDFQQVQFTKRSASRASKVVAASVNTPFRDARLWLGLILAVLALVLMARPNLAQAQMLSPSNTAARVSAQIKPCFGMLLDYQIKSCGNGVRTPSKYGYYGGGKASSVLNCDKAAPGAIDAVASRIRAGGVLRLTGNRSCVGTLNLTRSITIIGSGIRAGGTPAIVAPDGQPCVRISPSAKRVVFKDVYLYSPRGQMAACVDAANSEVTFQNSMVRYDGDNAAILVAGGRLNLIEQTYVSARTKSAAIAVRDAVLMADNAAIASTSSGLYGVLNGDSVLQNVNIQQLADWHGFERGEGATGLDLQLDSRGAIMTINDVKISHFATGLNLDGTGEVLVSKSWIKGADHGVNTGLDRVRLINNVIEANEIGINVKRGVAFVGQNSIARIRTAGMLTSSLGQIRAVDNMIDSGDSNCGALNWGTLPPETRVCTPWFKGSAFDTPADAEDQVMFSDFWPKAIMADTGLKPYSSLSKQDPVDKN